MVSKLKCFAARNKVPLLVLAVFYGCILYILNFACIQNDIHVFRDKLENKIVIEVEKK